MEAEEAEGEKQLTIYEYPTYDLPLPITILSEMEHQTSSQQVMTKNLALEDESEKIKAQIEQKKLADSYFIRRFIQRHPKLVLLGVSAFLFFTIYSSVTSIFQIGTLKEETVFAPVITTNTANTPPASTDDNSLPLWLLGAIALGGTIGGIAIAKRLSSSSSELSQFFLQFNSSRQPQQFPPSRQSILSLSALKLSEPKPTWADNSMETESKLRHHSETDEFLILIEEEQLDDGKENFLETLELTPEEKSLIFENIIFTHSSESSPEADTSTSEIELHSATDNKNYSSRSQSLAEILDLRQKLSLATLLEINK